METVTRTGCVVVGGGPAGMVLGLLLARAGVSVTVLEKHGDFLRDFRGDTVHPSTLDLLDELGLGAAFESVPHRKVTTLTITLDTGPVAVGDMARLRGPNNHIAFVPQWDFLDLIAEAARAEPTFTLRMSTEATDVVTEDDVIVGVRYRDADGTGVLRAPLVIACDGRRSAIRASSGLRTREFGVPMDVWWFRLPKTADDPSGGVAGRISSGQGMVLIDRGDYLQSAYLIGKGANERLRGQGIGEFRRRVSTLMPSVADRMSAVTGWDDVKLLDVRLNRLPRWYRPGLLCIGDAAHAMSPIGGVGINLAVQDAVAAARVLARPLRAGRVGVGDLARVQSRRWLPTALTQGLQRFIHRRFLGRALSGSPTRAPWPMRMLNRFPRLRVVPAYLIGVGVLPEHAPDFARRRPMTTDRG